MRTIVPAAILAGLVLGATAAAQDNPATRPAPREGGWMQLHEKYVQRAKEGHIDLLFLGDSITQGWNDNEVWQRHYGPRHAANMGIGGDRTQHVLWRIDHGEIDGIHPKAVVLMIGTNNLGSDSPAQIADGIKAIVGRLREKLPDTKVLLLGVFPRGAERRPDQASAKQDSRIDEINDLIESLDDDNPMVVYRDIGERFLDEEGRIPKEIMPDFLHLSLQGYGIWADAIEPTLWDIMDEPREPKP